jgi:uncharacterized protein (TIGR02246 family)
MHSQRLATYAACVFTGIALTAILRAQAMGSGADEKAIRSMMAATTDAFNDHDAQAWARYCTPTARLVTVRGESMEGAAEIEKGLTSIFQTRGRTARLRSLDVSVRFLRTDVALAYVTNEMSGLVSADGHAQPSHQELSIRVLVKDAGFWKIAAFHNTMLPR